MLAPTLKRGPQRKYTCLILSLEGISENSASPPVKLVSLAWVLFTKSIILVVSKSNITVYFFERKVVGENSNSNKSNTLKTAAKFVQFFLELTGTVIYHSSKQIVAARPNMTSWTRRHYWLVQSMIKLGSWAVWTHPSLAAFSTSWFWASHRAVNELLDQSIWRNRLIIVLFRTSYKQCHSLRTNTLSREAILPKMYFPSL